MRATSADHAMGERIFTGWLVIVDVYQLRRQLPAAKRAQLWLLLGSRCARYMGICFRGKAALGAFTPMSGIITIKLRREDVRYLPFKTANITSSVAGIIEDVYGPCAWGIADLAGAPMLIAIGFPIDAVSVTALAGIIAYLAGRIA